MQVNATGRFVESIVSYPQRGKGGSNAWRGNFPPQLVQQFLLTFHTTATGALDTGSLVADPMKGSDTTGDVCRSLGVPYFGTDLHQGFDAARCDLLETMGRPAKSIITHPPYYGMVRYSGSQWGRHAHPADLSQFGTDDADFDEMLQAIVQNIARATQPGGHYALLVGNWRQKGRYYHMASRVILMAPDDIVMHIVKEQSNVGSAHSDYSGRFVRTTHEDFLVFRRAESDTTFLLGETTLARLETMLRATWRNVIASAFRSGEATTAKALLERLERHPRAKTTNNLYAKIRQILREHPEQFDRIARGKYALAS